MSQARDPRHPDADREPPPPEARGASAGEQESAFTSAPTQPAAGHAGPVFAAGQQLAGRYRIERYIARGGAGQVYEAQDLQSGQRVALKTIAPGIAGRPKALARFRREIQLARKVSHPNVCRLFDLDQHVTEARDDLEKSRTVLFLTMELLDGEPLSVHLRRAGRLSAATALPIIRQVADALEAAHGAGIIHRDIKSGNILLVAGGGEAEPVRAVVTDFGLARVSEGDESVSLTETGDVVGTPAYMAPEQVQGLEVSVATDIYAFGVVIYEMVTGRRPFSGTSPLSTAIKRLTEAPPSPRVYVADLTQRWEQVILRCLEQDPSARYGSAREVVAALESGEPPPGRRESLRFWLRSFLR